jgi:Signal transduction histidine kinase involved in nitrogen fixation and metabolism regulation
LKHYITHNFIVGVIILIILVAASAYFATTTKVLMLITAVILAACAFAWVLFLYKRNTNKLKYMFDAIENNDLSFQYAIDKQLSDDKTISELINRSINTMLQTKIETLKQEVFYEQIINCVNIGIFVVDENGYIIQKNNKILQLLGLSSFSHINQIKNINEKLTSHLANLQCDDKFNFSYETEYGDIDISVNISAAKLNNKTMFIVTFSDINNEMNDKELDSWVRLIRVITHEMTNYIAPITSISDTLLSTNNYDKKNIQNGLEVISKTGKGLMSFVESYRRFTHISKPQPTLFYLKNFIERMILLARQNNNHNNIEWQIDVQPSDLILHADENLIGQVMINLLKNAIQAINEQADGLIVIKASCNASESIIIEVSNNGTAIPEEEAAQIFVPFFTTKEHGSGVGLSIARQIMRLSGGNIILKKEHSLGMTTFVLTFS